MDLTTTQTDSLGTASVPVLAMSGHPYALFGTSPGHAERQAHILRDGESAPGHTSYFRSMYRWQAHSHLPVLFSALRVSPPSEEVVPIDINVMRKWEYKQPIKIPSYLVAIAAGEVVWRKMGKVRCSSPRANLSHTH